MIKICMLLLFLVSGVCAEAADMPNQGPVLGALLQAKISAIPIDASRGRHGQIQPGAQVKMTTIVKNVGDQPNAPGQLFVRFAYPKPLDKHENSILYQTETVNLPTIEPGDSITINFSSPHQWPSLFDYIRHDWAMREYEALVVIGDREQLIGTTAIAFSAYYYEGPIREQAVKVLSSSVVNTEQTRRKTLAR